MGVLDIASREHLGDGRRATGDFCSIVNVFGVVEGSRFQFVFVDMHRLTR